MMLEIKNITMKFKEKTAVKDFRYSFKPGIYGLLGANGAGKTTLMKIVCGLIVQTSGEVLLDNKNIRVLKEKYYDLVGYLPQEFGYYPNFTAKEYLHYVAAIKGLPITMHEKKVNELLETVSLTEVANKRIRTFSGGMKQRLGIAQVMLNDPQIVIFDEPTAGLDPKERVRFRNLISRLSENKIVIFSTHIVSDIEYIADEIIVMQDGEIAVADTPDTITKTICGNVWECFVTPKIADELMLNYCVANIRKRNNDIEVRVISNQKPFENAELVEPCLEDLYLYYFQNNN